mmetsp:Transcript_20080/g.34595  ORF Transcript_20080/g.34595 Transcript_20080/m.34595 type:complete len:339 (+) Transcript_20080:41-1057(+)
MMVADMVASMVFWLFITPLLYGITEAFVPGPGKCRSSLAVMQSEKNGEDFSRRELLDRVLPTILIGSQLPWGSAIADEGAMAVQAVEGTAAPLVGKVKMKSYVDRKLRYRIEIPEKWLVSKRISVTLDGLGGGIMTPNGGVSSSGTVFVAGNYTSGVTVGISYTDARKMLDDAGFDNTGPINTIADIGKPMGVANLLVRQRDGDPAQPSPVSRVDAARSTALKTPSGLGVLGDLKRSDPLDFQLRTIIKIAGSGLASKVEDINLRSTPTKYRITFARAYVQNGIILTAWASATEDQLETEGQILQDIVDSFDVNDKFALTPVIGGYQADEFYPVRDRR